LQVLEKLDLPPPDYSDIHAFKKMVDERIAVSLEVLGSPPPDIRQTDHQVPIYDGSTVRVRVYQPVPPPKSGSPLIVMYAAAFAAVGLHSFGQNDQEFQMLTTVPQQVSRRRLLRRFTRD
jgi:hypothetical protein